ncbi:MAG: hypothetical protein HZB98_12465 [Bacteroidia bacterium]|nr:hypothetical protein [Bacteroidia bacterium]
MELFRKIRLSIGNAILRKRVTRTIRKLEYRNFTDVRSIGVVWNACRHEDFQALARFHQKMNERNIEVKVIGYYSGKNLPDQYTAIRYLTCIRKSETNLFYIPESTEIQEFTNRKFDILIDINFEKIFSLLYVTKLSKASLKVGIFEPEANTPFDMMLEIKYPVQLDEYLKQVIQYLEMIKN